MMQAVRHPMYPAHQRSNAACIRGLIVKLAVNILSKERFSNDWQSILFQQLQPLLKSVIDIDLSAASDDCKTSSTEMCQ